VLLKKQYGKDKEDAAAVVVSEGADIPSVETKEQ